MESNRMVMFVTMMIVMVMGNLLIETEADAPPQPSPFKTFSCIKTCLEPPSSQMDSTNEINHNDYYCKLGCSTHHCASLSSIQNPNVDKVVDCVDSCSDKCSNKN
ncbi:thionin-like protein [Arabidopsis thaliana]|uniref:Thionin-like protein n=1 Tax=Arabidopsis thaliana TaxID=3702 RepID=F4IDV2_ARATH|nr:thionin-like protein [Arabidopsis thaliana]AEE28913.1 thionin-like protein [Arabidopsis thaliana]|eukprot:NP_001184973.1 thionin-like protein [Arabidopsis thaliana]